MATLHPPLWGTVALVTGASSGIGAATARRLAADGAAVVLVARRHSLLDELASQIARAGGSALALEADITDRVQAEGAVERAVSALGRLDILVNNAGVMLLGPAAESAADEWDRMLALNVQGTLQITRGALPHLVRAAGDSPRGLADIVNIGSTAGRVARPGAAVYSLTKSGIAAFAESLRQELIGERVRVGMVEPGTVDTELVTHLREDVQQAARTQIESIEPLRPEDVADAVSYIVTRERRVAVNEILLRAATQSW
jgi:NADP-dependent 3-hydroxy acid dehydrogenase YdfG